MTRQHIETLIIGACQAGLATGYHLKQLGREFLILDGNARVGDNWRWHWDSLRLFHAGEVRRGFRACCFRATHGRSPARTTSPTTWRRMPSRWTCRCGCRPGVDRLEVRPGGGPS
jgi:putative flavoprotein involved in K+ transport